MTRNISEMSNSAVKTRSGDSSSSRYRIDYSSITNASESIYAPVTQPIMRTQTLAESVQEWKDMYFPAANNVPEALPRDNTPQAASSSTAAEGRNTKTIEQKIKELPPARQLLLALLQSQAATAPSNNLREFAGTIGSGLINIVSSAAANQSTDLESGTQAPEPKEPDTNSSQTPEGAPAAAAPDKTRQKKPKLPGVPFIKVSLGPSTLSHQPVTDIFLTIRQERELLLQGTRFDFHIGTVKVTGLPKRFAMAASPILNAHFKQNPHSNSFSVEAGYADASAIRHLLLKWPTNIAKHFEATELSDGGFLHDIPLIRAAKLLGMQRYCAGMEAFWTNWLSRHLPYYDWITCVQNNRLGDEDPLWTAMIGKLAHRLYLGQIPDLDVFDKFLSENPECGRAVGVALGERKRRR